ncbi:MAG TPA: hypothetical protein VFS21_33320 [Roseiflexaceae bacterium]|nr:hypothetical protein [Roseiflexaceae bacterium]
MSQTVPTYEDVRDGLHELFLTVPGIVACLNYEPLAIDQPPIIYSLLDSFERSQNGGVTAMRYRILHRLCLAWQDNEQAEAQLTTFVNAIPAVVDRNPQLAGRIPSGLARIAEAQAVWVKIGSTTYRALDCYSDVLTKAGYKSGI